MSATQPDRGLPRSARIAVINDDAAFLQLMGELLGEDEGYEVQTRTQWEDAHGFVRAWRPDVVILDLRVGGEQRGWEILELLRLDPRTRPIPVVLCSADRKQMDERAALLRTYDVRALAKPFDLDDLLRLVSELLGDRAARA